MKAICPDCGARVIGHSHYCDICRPAHQAEMLAERRKRYEANNHAERLRQAREYKARRRAELKEKALMTSGAPAGLVLLEDPRPLDDGGFRKGAQFLVRDLRAMLNTVLEEPILLDGTRFGNDKGKVFVVRRGKLMVCAG